MCPGAPAGSQNARSTISYKLILPEPLPSTGHLDRIPRNVTVALLHRPRVIECRRHPERLQPRRIWRAAPSSSPITAAAMFSIRRPQNSVWGFRLAGPKNTSFYKWNRLMPTGTSQHLSRRRRRHTIAPGVSRGQPPKIIEPRRGDIKS